MPTLFQNGRRDFNNLVHVLQAAIESYDQRPLFGVLQGGQLSWTSFRQFGALVDQFRAGLSKLGVKRGDALKFYAGDISVHGPHPFSSSGGNLGTGRVRAAMYTDSIEQLRGQAGKRQVKVRAETALAAFTTPPNGGWMMFGKHPS